MWPKMDRAHYHYNRYLGLVVSNDPKDSELLVLLQENLNAYIVYIDNRRLFARVKGIFLKRLVNITKKERTYSEPLYIRIMLLFEKQCRTIIEMLAN